MKPFNKKEKDRLKRHGWIVSGDTAWFPQHRLTKIGYRWFELEVQSHSMYSGTDFDFEGEFSNLTEIFLRTKDVVSFD